MQLEYDETKPGDDLSSYIGISGVGLTVDWNTAYNYSQIKA
jgi:hypothetical protein